VNRALRSHLMMALSLWALSLTISVAAEIGLSRQAVAVIGAPAKVVAVVVSGQIVDGDANRVAALFSDAKRTDDGHQFLRLIIHSPGGLVGEAIEIGKLVRSNSVEVFIPAQASCISACVLIIAGGAKRNIQGRVGVDHPHFIRASGPGDDVPKLLSDTKKIIRDYLKLMGTNEDLANLMFSLPEGDVHFLSHSELLEYRLN
jgi:hypothetical protein